VVLFHFSGYGNPVQLPSPGDRHSPGRGLIPSDGLLPRSAQPLINSLLEGTLDLLVRSLATEQVTRILDTSSCLNARSLQGNLRGRSLSRTPTLPSLEELALQSQLRQRLMRQGAAADVPPQGLLLRGARSEQVATEIALNGTFSGLFTYALTQSLWATTPARRLYLTLTRTAEQMAPCRGDQQQIDLSQGRKVPLLTYGLLPDNQANVEGLITQILDETTIELRWVGLPRALLLNYGLNSILTPLGNRPEGLAPVRVQVRSQNGLTAIARILQPSPEVMATLSPGQGLQEVIRVIPRKQGLILALDTQLERIERVDATSALASIPAIAALAAPGEGAVDCILAPVSDPPALKPMLAGDGASEGKSEETRDTGAPLGEKPRYGLLSEGGVRLPHTAGKRGEAIKSAVGRLEPQWHQFLAAKLWNLTQNEHSTRLKVRATLEAGSPTLQPIISKASQRQSLLRPDRAPDNPLPAPGSPDPNPDPLLPQLVPHSPIRFRLENHDSLPLYYCLLGLDSHQQAIAHFPGQRRQETDEFLGAIAPGETVLIPEQGEAFPLLVGSQAGLEQWLIIFTRQPCDRLLATWAQGEETDGPVHKTPFAVLSHPLKIAQALLADLHRISQVDLDTYEISAEQDPYVLDVQAWASLSLVYQIG
jgi:hypothetical protein